MGNYISNDCRSHFGPKTNLIGFELFRFGRVMRELTIPMMKKKRALRINKGGFSMAPSANPQIMEHDGFVPSLLKPKGSSASPFTTRTKSVRLFIV